MIILDTDVCISVLRGDSRAAKHFAAGGPRVATTAITAGELRYGAEKSDDAVENHGLVSEFLKTLPVLDISVVAAAHFGVLKATLEKEGQRLEDADLWIAAITLQHGATLATGNVRHYGRINNLTIENWLRDSKA